MGQGKYFVLNHKKARNIPTVSTQFIDADLEGKQQQQQYGHCNIIDLRGCYVQELDILSMCDSFIGNVSNRERPIFSEL